MKTINSQKYQQAPGVSFMERVLIVPDGNSRGFFIFIGEPNEQI